MGGGDFFLRFIRQTLKEMLYIIYNNVLVVATSEAGKYLFRAVNVWWRCVQYIVIVSCD